MKAPPMEKKVLAAVDGSLASRRALEYAGRMAAVLPGMRLTLLHIQPGISQFLQEEARRRPGATAALKQALQRHEDAARALLSECREAAVRAGVAADAIEAVTLPRRQGAAKDILDYAQNDLYDALLIGRRGVSGLQELLFGSVSSSLLQNSRLIPIWLVNGQVRSERILAAVDGSPSSFKAIDHLCFMLSGNPDCGITLLHVTPQLRDFCAIDFDGAPEAELESLVAQSDARCMDAFWPAARRKLAEAGIAEERIEIRTTEAPMKVGKAILKLVRQGGFGTVVLGRRGLNQSFFSGSVSNYVLERLDDAAAWIIP